MSVVALARWVLVLGSLAATAWYSRARRTRRGEPTPARLRVVSRMGLSARCGLALVEAERGTFLVAYGDGFAEFQRLPEVTP